MSNEHTSYKYLITNNDSFNKKPEEEEVMRIGAKMLVTCPTNFSIKFEFSSLLYLFGVGYKTVI